MKYLFLISATCLALCSCAKKSNGDLSQTTTKYSDYPKLILGKWQEIADTTKTITKGVVTNNHISGVVTYYNSFNADGTGSEINSISINPITYKISDNKITINYTGLGASSETAVIKVLNATTLCLYFDDIDAQNSIEVTEVIWFRKQ